MNNSYLKCPSCGHTMTVNRQRTGRASKRIGNQFELKIAKLLSKLTGMRWKRCPASGAWIIPGDIWCVDLTTQPFLLECKHREDITLDKVLSNPSSVEQWLGVDTAFIFSSKGKPWVILHELHKPEDFHFMGCLSFRRGPAHTHLLSRTKYYLTSVEEFAKILPQKEKEVPGEK